MTDNNNNGGLPPEVVQLPEATPPNEIDLDSVTRSNAIVFMERLVKWMKEHESNGREVRSVVVAVNGVPGLWAFSNTTDVTEQCTLLRVALETKQRNYVATHTDFQHQELSRLARRKQLEQQGENSDVVVPFSSSKIAFESDLGDFNFAPDFDIGESSDDDPDPGPAAA